MAHENQRNHIEGILNEPLAIIGMNCQFPGIDADVEDVQAFYELLLSGQSPIKEVPRSRWDIEKYYDADRKKADKIISRHGGFLNNPELFDAAFFKLSSAETKQIDPQQRLFLEVSIRALNHANITLDSLKDTNTGVYCGISTHEYSQLKYKDNVKFNAYTPIGIANSAAAGRLSHVLNLKGPSMAVDTGCSSSFSALYLAATALRIHQCNMAIVGGVHLSLCPESFMGLTKANMLSASGKCRSFDAKADGFVRSEGCGVIIVKRLQDAIEADDKIHAVIKSIVMNQNGDGTGLMVPDVEAQIAMHQAALAQANLAAGDIDYIETHGTGTAVGDPVEFQAIQCVHLGHHRQDKPLIIGALKSNIGHTISSSGIASLIKAVCAFRYETIAPNLHYTTPNNMIEPDSIPALIATESVPFQHHPGKKRYAQVSNFSFSGTNISVVIEEPPKQIKQYPEAEHGKPYCFVASAHSERSLRQMLTNYVQFLRESAASLHDVCCTLINCRDHYQFRLAIIVRDKETLIKQIESEEYEIKKTIVHHESITLANDAQQIYDAYLKGLKPRLDPIQYQKIDLPLYYFDRKPYWHEPRNRDADSHWLNGLYCSSKEGQIETIKGKIAPLIQEIVEKEPIDEHQDFESLGFTEPLLDDLYQALLGLFPSRLKIPNSLLSPYLTLDKLARHLQQIIMSPAVHRQPSIKVLNIEPIAIVGMSCRLPRAANVDEFLSLLVHGESGMVDIPPERWDNDQYYDPDANALGRLYIKQLGLIDHVKAFDADFFNISPREAKLMAPQLRVFMEESYHALEDANLPLDIIKDSNTGVFVGVGTNEYPGALAALGVSLEELNIYFATGNVLNALAGRVAYAFDFHGPIQAIDTACSSSMTAIHNACLSLQSGECDMALAGGVNILLTPYSNITLSKAKMLSPESRCKTFSEDADGYARSEGCGVVVLKRLSTAIQDEDGILAIIKGSSINSDGKSGGFTVPNGIAQEEVIRSSLAKSGLSPKDIDYIETHGTGTPLADPIEVNALTRIFSEHHSPEKPLYISSVKTNIGHSESASGVASLIKAVLSIKTQKIFKHLNFKKLNPAIELKNTAIPLQTIDWHKPNGPRCAGVSSFGFSGANAHIILQEAPRKKQEGRTLPKESLLLISAKNKTSLELLLSSYQTYLSLTEHEFADICFTAATCRSHFLFRVAIKANSAREAAALIAKKEYQIHQIQKEQEFCQKPGTLEQMQAAYQEGHKVNWRECYQSLGYQFLKVKLPLYEFTRTEHWYGHKDKLKDALPPKDWCFQLQWEQQAYDNTHRKTQGGHWLLVGNPQKASGFGKEGLHILQEEDDYSFNALAGIIFAAPLETCRNDIHSQKEILKTLLNLIKKIKKQNRKEADLRLVVLTANGIPELAGDNLNLSHSSLIGFCKTLALELPQYSTILIDLENPDDKQYAAQVVAEIEHNQGAHYEHLVAYRKGKRYVPRLKRVALEDGRRSLHNAGRYLITGGSGGLGLVTAQALLSAGAKELILTARHIDKPEIKKAIQKIQSFYPGRTVRMVSLDVTDKEGLRAFLAEINADGLLKGIIHAAGAAVKAPLLEHREEDVDYVFSAKVQGGWNLHELTQHCDLDFFIVYSSIASVFGSNKESVYGAANGFLDALIAERQRLGLVGTAIQWGPWGEVGMAQNRSRNQNLKKALIANDQGYTLIKMLLNSRLSHAAIISPDYLKFMLDFVPKPRPLFHEHLAKDLADNIPEVNPLLSPWLSSYLRIDSDKRLKACKDMLGKICKEILELADAEDINEDTGFFELGFDSLMITEMAARLKKELEPYLKVTVSIGFDYPSIDKLARFIESELNHHLIKQQVSNSSEACDDSIAIVGMSCSLPNAPDVAAFERLLEQGLSGIQDIPLERWDNRKYYDPNINAPLKSYVNKLGLIENIKCFDAHFFGISPREAKLIEPQQRIFLECCYKALENANYPANALRGSLTGVFAGVGPNEYYGLLEKMGFSNEELSAYSITGNVLNLIPGRVAYTFDLKGPSISVDTACSSSLVAIHYACQSLKNREIDYALAGGVNILLLPESNITLCKARALSPDGQCKTFDEKADGYVRAEGCGVLFLKRTSDALRDKDHILAVIKASAVNNDGQSAGLTVPNGKSQEEVMLKALAQSDLASCDVGYIEAHGTGTALGDPIEVHAINKIYGESRDRDNPLYIGTVKTNIGHLESAAGVAGVIKTVIGIQNKKIYKNLNFNRLNPNIKLNGTRIALQNIDWHHGSKPLCAGVNAFGFSGTNAHVILQEFPANQSATSIRAFKKHLLVLSAKSRTALTNLANRYQQYLATTPHHFADICFTAATCREHYPHRLAVMAASAEEASRLLSSGQFVESAEENHRLDIQDIALKSLLLAYLRGEEVNWASYYKTRGDEFKKILLPNYTFDRHEYWLDKKSSGNVFPNAVHPLLGQMISLPNNEYLFHQKLDLENLSYINQHSVFEKMVFPATAYIECGLAVAGLIFKGSACTIEKFTIERPFFPKQDQEFQLQAKPQNDGLYQINIFAREDISWQRFSSMEIKPQTTPKTETLDLDALKSECIEKIDVSEIYEDFRKRSLFYGDEFHVLQEGYVQVNQVLAKVGSTKANYGSEYYFHPILLDGAMQSLLLLATRHADTATYVPYAIKNMTTYQEAPRNIWVHLTKRATKHENELGVDIKLYDNSGLLIGEIEELKLRAVTRKHFASYEPGIQHLYSIKWQPLDSILQANPVIPELWVVAKDEVKAEKALGHMNYQLIKDMTQFTNIKDKHIVFLHDQEFSDLFHCCQTMFKSSPRSFIFVTENAYAVREGEPVNPYHTMASSFWKSFSNELELNKNYTVDLGPNETLAKPLTYIFSTDDPENQLAVRDSIYVPRLKKTKLPVSNVQEEPLFDAHATYLITGGTGGLGKALIKYLTRRGAKHLVITSRSECPEDIKILIKHEKQNQAFITHYKVDASHYQHMEQLIADIQSIRPLKGVFHLAGLVRDGLIVNLNDEDMQSVFSAKMESALILHQLTKHLHLDVFVLFSSTASLLGARGQANYAAANGFLDGLAHFRQQQGLPALTINWGPFHETGMTTNLTQILKQRGFMPLNKDNLEILDVLLKTQLPQIALCPVAWDTYFNYSPKQAWLSELAHHKIQAQQHFLNSLKLRTREEKIAILSQTLCEIAADVLGLDDTAQITAKDNLFSMGMDSLMAIDIRNRIHDKLQCEALSLSIEYFINSPSIAKIARNIADEIQTLFAAGTSNNLPFAEPDEEIPLCDFQYIFWVLNKFQYSFNIGMQVQLHGKLNQDYLFQAFNFVIHQNKAFWIYFNHKTPTQRLRQEGQFKLLYKDISLSHEIKSLNDEFHSNTMRVIPLNEQPLIRVYLYKMNHELHELHMIIPHIIVDDVSCEIVFSQFKTCYEALVLGKKLTGEPIANLYFRYVKQSNHYYEKNLQEKIGFWQKYNHGFQMLSFGAKHHLPDAARQVKHLFHYTLEPLAIEKLINWHREKNLNVSSGLIAACQIVFYKISRQNKIPIILIHSGRERSEYKSVVGLFSEYKRINITLSEQYQFIDCIQSIEEQLTKTAPYQKCSHFIRDAGLKGSRVTIGQYLTTHLNKLLLTRNFKEKKVNAILTGFYIKYLSQIAAIRRSISIKFKLNQLFNWNLCLQKPDRLRTLISITPSFFTKEIQKQRFANLNYSFPDHFASANRPIGNQTLWIYFSKNQHGEYQLSINGPLTTECKNLIASEFSRIISAVVENDGQCINNLLE